MQKQTDQEAPKGRVCVAMSGGVDSSVAALLLKQQGYDVVGISMRLYDSQYKQGHKGGCCTPKDMDDARRVAEKIGIPYYLFNYQNEFQNKVIDQFVDDYLHGRTPNPCVRCNQDVKFSLLFQEAAAIGCDALATGHYARITQSDHGEYSLWRGVDRKKDQSYFLFGLTQKELSHLMFPLGSMTKSEIRDIAKANDLPIHDKPDSQEICFVAGGSYVDVVKEHSPLIDAKGPILDQNGQVLGQHDGYYQYTIGQRRGLGALDKKPKYVLKVLPQTHTVIVGDESDLIVHNVHLQETRWTRLPMADEEVLIQLRYQSQGVKARVQILSDHEADIQLLEPAKGAAPGQAAVCYVGDEAIGGGFIK